MLINCGNPGMSNATVRIHFFFLNKKRNNKNNREIKCHLNKQQAVSVGGVDRLTDTSKYTGAHKERFDASGKGKGISGREDVQDTSGYVGGYKGKDTYDKTHK